MMMVRRTTDVGQMKENRSSNKGEQQKGLMNNCFPIIVKFREKLFFLPPSCNIGHTHGEHGEPNSPRHDHYCITLS